MAVRLAPTMTTSLMADSTRIGPARGRYPPIMRRHAAPPQTVSRSVQCKAADKARDRALAHERLGNRRARNRLGTPVQMKAPAWRSPGSTACGIGLDLGGPGLPGELHRGGDQRRRDAATAPARGNVEAVERPGRRFPRARQRLAAFEPGKSRARADGAPTHRRLAVQGNDAGRLAGLDQRLERRAIRRALGRLPGLAAHRHAPPHAPATAAGAVAPNSVSISGQSDCVSARVAIESPMPC